MEQLIDILQNFGVSVAVIVALMWYIIYKDKAHKEETKTYADALQKNTEAMTDIRIVMERLCTVIGGDGDGKTA